MALNVTHATVTGAAADTTALVDGPAWDANHTLTGTASIAQGGTGQTTAADAFDALAPTTTRGDLIFRNATTNARLAAGTSGYALVAAGAGADPAWTGFLQSGTGATTRTWNAKASDWLSVKDFGATGDGSTNDTAALNLALAAAYAAGKEVFIPAGTYIVDESSSGSGYALLNRGVSMIGEGRTSIIAPKSTMPNTADFILIHPVTATDVDNLRLENFLIYPNISGTKRGKRGIYFLIDGVTNVGRFHMDGVYVTPGNDYSLQIENNPNTNPQGCPSNSLIERCAFWEGSKTTYCGDSFVIRNNILRSTDTSTRPGCFVYMTDAAGVAGHLIFEGNNVDCDGAALTVVQGREVKILYNNIEQSYGAGTNGAVIDLDGSSGSLDDCAIVGNHVGIFGTATVSKAIRLGVADRTFIDGNRLLTSITVASGISIGALCDDTRIGISNSISGFTAAITDVGTGTGYGFPSGVQANFTPITSDGAALGTTAKMWSDLFLANGGVINFNNGDVTITHIAANTLLFAGAGAGYAFDAIVYPNTNDGAALGSGTNSFSDLFLASGGVINFNNGDITITHSADALAFAGGTFSFPAAGLTIGGVVPREKLSANRDYYVRTDGSDSNTGLANTSGGAFLTINAAINAAAALDQSIYSVEIHVGAGTYTTPIVLKSYVGAGPIRLTGDTATPGNVIISTTSSNAITGDGVIGNYVMGGFKIVTTTSGLGILISNGTRLAIDGLMEYGTIISQSVAVTSGASLTISANWTISGNSTYHWFVLTAGQIIISGTRTITLTGTPAFSTVFANVSSGGVINASSLTFSGSASAGTKQYTVTLNGVLNSSGATLPGGVAGTTATGGQFA